ncbi:MAG: DUF1697 domain-containing protein [Acidimicrobiia bacterium]
MRYVALLRGIAPANPKMRNENLRGVIEALGYERVETVISSGNVLFDAETTDVRALEDRIEAAWPEHLGFSSTTIVRSAEQIHALAGGDPFDGRPDERASSLQVTFLKDPPTLRLDLPYTPEAADYTVVAADPGTVFSVVDLTRSRTPDLMRWLERTFGKQITTRTWKTVHRLARKL